MKSAFVVILLLVIQTQVVEAGFVGEIVVAILAFLCSLPFISFLSFGMCDMIGGCEVDCPTLPPTQGDTECNENTALELVCSPAADCESSAASISLATIRSQAEMLALVYSTSLTAPPELVEQFVTSLGIIAVDHVYLKSIMESPYASLPWVPSEIFVAFTEEAKEEIAAGTYNSTELDQLNEELGPVEILDGSVYLYRFEKLYHPERLASMYETIPGIDGAEPNFVIGKSQTVVVNNEGTQFTFSVGWGDCPAGCLFWYSWSFCVDNNEETISQMDSGCGGSYSIDC